MQDKFEITGIFRRAVSKAGLTRGNVNEIKDWIERNYNLSKLLASYSGYTVYMLKWRHFLVIYGVMQGSLKIQLLNLMVGPPPNPDGELISEKLIVALINAGFGKTKEEIIEKFPNFFPRGTTETEFLSLRLICLQALFAELCYGMPLESKGLERLSFSLYHCYISSNVIAQIFSSAIRDIGIEYYNQYAQGKRYTHFYKIDDHGVMTPIRLSELNERKARSNLHSFEKSLLGWPHISVLNEFQGSYCDDFANPPASWAGLHANSHKELRMTLPTHGINRFTWFSELLDIPPLIVPNEMSLNINWKLDCMHNEQNLTRFAPATVDVCLIENLAAINYGHANSQVGILNSYFYSESSFYRRIFFAPVLGSIGGNHLQHQKKENFPDAEVSEALMHYGSAFKLSSKSHLQFDSITPILFHFEVWRNKITGSFFDKVVNHCIHELWQYPVVMTIGLWRWMPDIAIGDKHELLDQTSSEFAAILQYKFENTKGGLKLQSLLNQQSPTLEQWPPAARLATLRHKKGNVFRLQQIASARRSQIAAIDEEVRRRKAEKFEFLARSFCALRDAICQHNISSFGIVDTTMPKLKESKSFCHQHRRTFTGVNHIFQIAGREKYNMQRIAKKPGNTTRAIPVNLAANISSKPLTQLCGSRSKDKHTCSPSVKGNYGANTSILAATRQ